jgi:8-oxo-dGTP pyrophosphatase MutT (NUDIX family)
MASAISRALRRHKGRGDVVQAAGGILLREVRRGRYEVALVYRSTREDWSLPKGKLDAGETLQECALREVLEETGYQCRLGRFVGSTEYYDRRGRPKVVGYWLMEVMEGEFAATEEVDDLRWLELDLARRALTYQRDRDLLASLDAVALARSG